jgi:hypothetical protein
MSTCGTEVVVETTVADIEVSAVSERAIVKNTVPEATVVEGTVSEGNVVEDAVYISVATAVSRYRIPRLDTGSPGVPPILHNTNCSLVVRIDVAVEDLIRKA